MNNFMTDEKMEEIEYLLKLHKDKYAYINGKYTYYPEIPFALKEYFDRENVSNELIDNLSKGKNKKVATKEDQERMLKALERSLGEMEDYDWHRN